ncbi:MAG: pantetheine-phosphate adenylyltransferase [Defluviitaleaceae bacterium]|nr:pantetheine-phosphate adenylyltransferase [Defluviitaleaceae bacterium]
MTAIYPGSFDPVTFGHIDIINRSAKIMDELIVGVLNNSNKISPLFSLEERIEMLKDVCAHLPNVRIELFSGLLVDFVNKMGAQAIIRGLRAVTDFETEFQMAQINKSLNDNAETLFMSTSPQFSYLSSSIVKEVAFLGGNVDSMIPDSVRFKLLGKIGRFGKVEKV